MIEIQSTYDAPDSLPKDGGGPTVQIFVVVRDERGGASFIRSRVQLEGAAP
jgi:hypothetical protein